MAHEQEHAVPPFDNNEDDDFDEYDDMDMSSSIISFGEPDLDEIALQIALLAITLVINNGDEDDDYEYVDYVDLYMPDIVEEYDEPDLNEVAWHVALLSINGDHDQPR
ncbi:hypothetical protein K457DRAFT_1822094 [Linnemannia elongata AG-77]|uniref:Uncharacterized protein n=1 Tax=Linnemannia elongata AG-77 TaxID=1314771 RepID=A0A197JPV0_9FUNG|nr:hypothetical protein K457DRAFT_1822094 [Linnemannia elongata AG-77]